jgi:hypothetical protein
MARPGKASPVVLRPIRDGPLLNFRKISEAGDLLQAKRKIADRCLLRQRPAVPNWDGLKLKAEEDGLRPRPSCSYREHYMDGSSHRTLSTKVA